MPGSSTFQLSVFPIAAVVATSLALTPVMRTPTPHALASELTASAQWVPGPLHDAVAHVATGVDQAGVSAAGLLANRPDVLGSVSLHDLATFVTSPQATAPLVSTADVPGVDGPTADLLAALQSALNNITNAVLTAPTEVLKSLGFLLSGDVRDGLNTLFNIVLVPVAVIGTADLGSATYALAQLFPRLAPVFNVLPDAVITAALPVITVFNDVANGLGDAFDALRAGLQNGDLGTAVGGFLQGVANGTATTLTNFLGPDGFVAGLAAASTALQQAIGQVSSSPLATRKVAADDAAQRVASDDDTSVDVRTAVDGRPITPVSVDSTVAPAAPSVHVAPTHASVGDDRGTTVETDGASPSTPDHVGTDASSDAVDADATTNPKADKPAPTKSASSPVTATHPTSTAEEATRPGSTKGPSGAPAKDAAERPTSTATTAHDGNGRHDADGSDS